MGRGEGWGQGYRGWAGGVVSKLVDRIHTPQNGLTS